MIEIQIDSGGDPAVLAELIASTLHGHIAPRPESTFAQIGRHVRAEQERAEQERPSRQQISTVNFATIDDEQDWTEI